MYKSIQSQERKECKELVSIAPQASSRSGIKCERNSLREPEAALTCRCPLYLTSSHCLIFSILIEKVLCSRKLCLSYFETMILSGSLYTKFFLEITELIKCVYVQKLLLLKQPNLETLVQEIHKSMPLGSLEGAMCWSFSLVMFPSNLNHMNTVSSW